MYRPGDFGPVRIEPAGYAIWFDKPDIGARIEDLLRAASGEDLLRSVAAQIMASAGTENKAQEARNNRLHGGRPAKRATRSSGPAAGTGTVSIKRPNPTNMAPTIVKFKGDSGSQRAQQAVVRGEPPGPTKGASYKIVQPAKKARDLRWS